MEKKKINNSIATRLMNDGRNWNRKKKKRNALNREMGLRRREKKKKIK